MKYLNFYETAKEANMRLKGTVIMYDGEPYHVAGVSNHKPDGIFRIYIEPLSSLPYCQNRPDGIPTHHYNNENNELGVALDKWLETATDPRMLRKMMNSPKFDNFRPFPLGMYNQGVDVFYIQRHPTRKTEQGLSPSALTVDALCRQATRFSGRDIGIHNSEFRDMLMGSYPTAQEALEIVLDPTLANLGVGFNRDFAIVSGPADTIFLGYRDSLIGLMPNGDFSSLILGKQSKHLIEVTSNLNLFTKIM